jgi:signal transduction histidine kinase
MPLRESKKELKAVVDNISDGVLFLDNDGIIKLYNRAIKDMLSIDADLTGKEIYSLPAEDPVRQGILWAEKGFKGPYCWERHKCAEDLQCMGKSADFCRCWLFRKCSAAGSSFATCLECPQYNNVKPFLEKPKELEIGDKMISVLSSFIEFDKKDEMWEVIVFRDVTSEKLDAVMKLANAAAHELRQPLQIITSSVDLARDNISEDSEIAGHFKVIKEGCYRLNAIIEKISRMTRYRTKHYIQDEKILDIEESSGDLKK